MRGWNPWRPWVWLFLAAALAAGCGDVATDGNDLDTGRDTSPGIDIYLPPKDTGRETGDDLVAPDDPGPWDAGDLAGDIPPGGTGAPCTRPSDCDSRFCLEGRNGLECAGLCSTGGSCMPGYECVQVSPPPDLIFACVFTAPKLCFPCTDDTDCKAGAAVTNSACVDYGDFGRFCGAPCTDDEDCLTDYECATVTTASAIETKQCVPMSGECACPLFAVQGGLSTPCRRVNDYGTCSGLRTCGAEGLSACSAPVPAPEQCDGKDNDCNGKTDDVPPVACLITTSLGSCPGTASCQNGKPFCEGTPPAQEQCNGADDNCDGATDEANAIGCRTFYKDVDLDTHGDPTSPMCLCEAKSPYTTTAGDDCDDVNAYVFPEAVEACNGRDDDCDGQTDEANAAGCKTFFRDGDGDKYGMTTDSQCLCLSKAPYTASLSGDCVDTDDKVHPGAPEVCNNKDDNCDGKNDPESAANCVLHYYDGDGDLYGDDQQAARCLCRPDTPAKFTTTFAGDCDDTDATVNPKSQEVCNTQDDDCNGQTDEPGASGCSQHWVDADGDTWGSGLAVCTCTDAAPYTAARGGDCDDGNAGIHPAATELCNTIDDNCSGLTDEEDASNCKVYYYDRDQDKYGTDSAKCLCAASGYYTAKVPGDCADAAADRNPGVPEVCANFLDDNCNGQTDEGGTGCVKFYADRDNDGAGNPTDSQCLCAAKTPYLVQNALDCNDTTAAISPTAPEVCNGTIDDNCNGVSEEEGASGCAPHFRDSDGDSYGSDLVASRCLCGPDLGTYFVVLVPGDCNDNNSAINPKSQEICGDGIDNNCNRLIDEEDAVGCTPWYYDYDDDGHGDKYKASICACAAKALYRSQDNLDCNDLDKTISGGLPELCGDNKDNNCDGTINEPGAISCTTFYKDIDGDDFGRDDDFLCLCAADTLQHYDTDQPGDCDDADPLVHPGGAACGKDGNCDGDPVDSGEECDDRNAILWDGCTGCKVSEVRLNRATTNDQTAPAVAARSDGSYATVFQSYYSIPLNEIVLRLMNADGTLSADDAIVNTYTTGQQTAPAVAAFGNGSFVVVWQSASQDGSGAGVFGQQYDTLAARKGTEFQVNGTTNLDQSAPRVAARSDGTFVVAWQSLLQDGSGLGVYARTLDALAVPITAEIPVPGTTANDQDSPAIAALPDGAFVTTWRTNVDRGSGIFDREIRHRVFNADGTPATNELATNAYTASDQQAPAIASLGSNGFVVVWHSAGQDSSGTGVFGRRFNTDGTARDAQDFPITTTVAGEQFGPAVGSSPDGKFVVAWSGSGQDGSGLGVYLQKFNAFGNYYGIETAANVHTNSDQTLPAVAALNGTFFVTWSSMSQDGSLTGVYGRRWTW